MSINRNSYIGGSDASVIMGLRPFGKTRQKLWEQKLGIAPETFQNQSMKLGLELEPKIRELLRGKDLKLEYPLKELSNEHFFYSDEYGYPCGGHADGLGILNDKKNTKVIVEIKTTSTQMTEFPLHYKMQMLHYAVLGNFNYGVAYVFDPSCQLILEHFLKFSDKLKKILIEKEQEFWHCVSCKKAPDPEEDLVKYYNASQSEKENVVKIKEFKKKIKEFELYTAGVKEYFCKQLKPGEGLVDPDTGDRLLNLYNMERKNFNTEKFKNDHPDLYKEYIVESKSITCIKF